jgi:hypothetical protein
LEYLDPSSVPIALAAFNGLTYTAADASKHTLSVRPLSTAL